MVHAALRKVGPVAGGADMIIAALRDAVGPRGTILGYADWQGMDDVLADEAVFNDPAIRPEIPPFDPKSSRATRDNGAFPELLRTTPGAVRSGNPGAAAELLPLVYAELRQLAAAKLANEKPGHTLEATALVQLYLALGGGWDSSAVPVAPATTPVVATATPTSEDR